MAGDYRGSCCSAEKIISATLEFAKEQFDTPQHYWEKVHTRHPKNTSELTQLCRKIISTFLLSSMQVLFEVTAAKAGSTSY